MNKSANTRRHATRTASPEALWHYAAIIASSGDAIMSKTLEGSIASWSAGAERMLGYSDEEAVGQPFLMIVPADRRDEEAHVMASVSRGIALEPYETVRIRKDGSLIDVSVTASPIRDDRGLIVGDSRIARDISPRKLADEKIQNSMREIMQLKAALDEHAIVAITGPRGDITYVNDKFCEISKYSREELLGQNHRIINSGHHPRQFFVDLWSTISSGHVWKGEIKNRAKDRSTYWVETTIVPFLNDNGTPVQYVAIRADITTRMEALEALTKQSDALWHYAAIVASSDDAIISKTLQSSITSWNPAAERLFGYSRQEAMGEPLSLIIPEEQRAEEIRILKELRDGNIVNSFDTVRRRKDGRLIDVSVAVSPIRDGTGAIIGGTQIERDNSVRKQAEEKIQASLLEIKQLKAALDEHAIVAITDPGGDITYVNDKFCEISRYSRAELLGQNHRIINSGHHPKQFFVDLWATISSGQVWKGEIRNRAKDGSKYWVDTTIVPFLNEKGRPVQYVAIRADITSRMLALEALTQRSDALARSNAAMEEFAYAASHDLQEPLRGVSGCVQLLRKNYAGQLDARADEFIRHSVTNVERMQSLILALLDYTRVDRRGHPLETVDSAAVLRASLANLETAIAESGAQVKVGALPRVDADRVQLLQLFQNLVGNAIKFRGAETPSIDITAETGGVANADWTFRIHDNGIGIDAKHAERIFGVFQRLHSRDKYAGTGIGLAICRKIVERHGGRLWVESEPGHGATFVFTLGKVEKEELV